MRRATTLSVGFIPLVDAAPVIVAHEMGFAAEEGIALDLRRAPSWSSLRDMLSFGQVDAAHMLSTLPVAAAMGLGGVGSALSAVMVLSVNGTVIGVNSALEARLRGAGHGFGFDDAAAAGQALLKEAGPGLRIGVPFPFSMHAELVHYWLSSLQPEALGGIEIRTVPPQLMPDAIEAQEIDAFCVGEPWGSRIVDRQGGALLLPGKAIWAFAPEKVLAVRQDWAETERSLLDRLIRAVWRSARWLAQESSSMLTTELLSRPDYLDIPPELIERALSGRLAINARGETRSTPGFVEFFAGAANFPWASQEAWIARQLAARTGRSEASPGVFRSDLFRAALASTGTDLPAGSAKREGALAIDSPVASASGQVTLSRNRFFDGRVFEPDGEKSTAIGQPER